MANISSYRALRGETNYLKLILANLINRFGDSIDAIAYSWMMYEITGSASLMALIVGLNYIPTVFLEPIAGVIVDRLPKKIIMVLMDIGRGLLVLLTAALLSAGLLTPGLLIAVTMSNSVLETLRNPAGSAIVPKLLPTEKYTVGTALNNTLSRITELVGLALAGGVIAWLGVTGALLIDVATFLLSALIIGWIHLHEERANTSAAFSGVFAGFRDGLRFVKGSPVLLALGLLGMMINLGAVPINVFGTAYVVDDLHAGAEMLSLMQIAMVAGMGLGAFITPKIKGVSNHVLMLLCGFILSFAMAALAFFPAITITGVKLAALITDMVIFGVCVGILNVVFNAAFMRLVPPERLGAMGGLLSAVLCCCMPIGSFLCSAAAGFVSVTETLLIAAVFTLTVYLIMCFVKPLKEI